MASSAFQSFEESCNSIGSLLRCADVFGIHALAIEKGESPDTDLIQRIIEEEKISSLARTWQFHMSKEQYQKFGEKGHIRAVCEHIVFASYVATEAYLIAKFKEYFIHLYQTPSENSLNALIKRFTLRSLKEINRHFKTYLSIQLSDFEHPQVTTYEEASWFDPQSCWEGLIELEKCRNELAHEGRFLDARLLVLVDAWSAFQFCRSYVQLFDCNYDSKIYGGRSVEFEAK